MKSAKQTFKAELIARGPKGAWTYLMVPFDVAATFGVKGTCKVHGSINGHEFRTSLMPNGDGTHHMVVSKEMMAGGQGRARWVGGDHTGTGYCAADGGGSG